MWLVKAPKPPLDEQIPQASIAPGDISAEQAEAMADAAHLQRWKEIWAEIAAKRQSAEPLTHKESSRRRAQAMVDGLNRHVKEETEADLAALPPEVRASRTTAGGVAPPQRAIQPLAREANATPRPGGP